MIVRRRSAMLALAIGLCAPASAGADTATARVRTAFRGKPSTTSRAIERVPAGAQLVVIDSTPDRLWLEVLYSGRDGWVAAADVTITVDEPAPAVAEDPGPPARHGPRREVWMDGSLGSDMPTHVLVTQPTANLVERPTDGAKTVETAKRDQRLVISHPTRDGRFFLVELDGQRVAWIAATAVEVLPTESVAVPPTTSSPPSSTRASPGLATAPADNPSAPSVTKTLAPPPRLRLHASGGFAMGQIEQRFASNGHGLLNNYGDKTGLAGVEIALALEAPFAGAWFVGGTLSYRFAGVADITARSSSSTVTLGVRSHDLEALGLVGYRVDVLGGLGLSLRAGMRMLLDLIDQDYTVSLPSERILALAVGAGLDAPNLAGGLGVALSGFYLPVGSRAESQNLGEGQDAGTTGFALSATLSYVFTDHLAMVLSGRYARIATHFDGKAERDPSITAADRVSALSTVTLGLRVSR